MSLLARARAAGLAVWSRDGRVAVEGPPAAEALALALLADEAGTLAALWEREGTAPWAVLPADADPARPPMGWYYVRSGRLAGLWIGPDGSLGVSRPPREAP